MLKSLTEPNEKGNVKIIYEMIRTGTCSGFWYICTLINKNICKYGDPIPNFEQDITF